MNLSLIKTLDDLYDNLSELFGFPDFFGRNCDALIDCWFYLRNPEAGMTNINISADEYLLLEIKNILSADKIIVETLFTSLKFLSLKCKEINEEPPIVLLLS
ncbi:hypothetical protein AFL46_15580 [Providencia stuartii]|nr:hypothetical protein AFL46_15580 [Providencia stuartii]